MFINALGKQCQNEQLDGDVISAINFDRTTGENFVVGDENGRVIIFKYKKLESSRYFDYKYLTEIQPVDLDFDSMKCTVVNRAVNDVSFLNVSTP